MLKVPGTHGDDSNHPWPKAQTKLALQLQAGLSEGKKLVLDARRFIVFAIEVSDGQ